MEVLYDKHNIAPSLPRVNPSEDSEGSEDPDGDEEVSQKNVVLTTYTYNDYYNDKAKKMIESKKEKEKINGKIKQSDNKACNGGDMFKCFGLAMSEREKGNLVEAKRLFKKMCDRGDKMGCYELAGIEEDKGNLAEARKLYKKACGATETMKCFQQLKDAQH